MGKERLFMQMGLLMMGIGRMTRLMDLALQFLLKINRFTRGSGRMEADVAKENNLQLWGN